MSSDYLPILIQILIAGGFAAVTLLISVVFGKSAQRSEVKDSAYECGMLPIGETQPRFSVKFYLVAMLFVIFDIEVVFMYPWAVTFQELVVRDGVTIAFWSALSFVGILFVAYLYALKKGALRWSD
ncbi:NADH-quinone oxidoreductase subunit A [Verrucomicrobiales bacterium]|nr:NADH-quinone oxidoreductase subunit A [Verrucomicrobiales bacterium]MDA7613955.1 NADH-quinone oxidoreductase subunit A [Verrucomicrobiales bacterium]MDA7666413.1 NADH-quinone oxidoreductase subunit A [bacterium]